jgi:hypothetical protein
MDLVQCEGMLAAAPAAGVIVSATRPVQALGRRMICKAKFTDRLQPKCANRPDTS